jgi:hypothetical protein
MEELGYDIKNNTKLCPVCKVIKTLNSNPWMLNKNKNTIGGKCSQCFREKAILNGKKRKNQHEDTICRKGDECPVCCKKLSNINITNDLRYVGCNKCGYKAGSYRVFY